MPAMPTKDEYGSPLSYRHGDDMQTLCLEWEDLAEEFFQQQEGDDGEEGDEGDEGDETKPKDGGEGDGDGDDEEDDGDGDGKGDDEGDEGDDEQSGDQPNGKRRMALTDEEDTGAEGFGTYAGGTSQFDSDALADALGAIKEEAAEAQERAVEEIEIVYREFLATSNEQWREGHRQAVKDAEAVWDNRIRRSWR